MRSAVWTPVVFTGDARRTSASASTPNSQCEAISGTAIHSWLCSSMPSSALNSHHAAQNLLAPLRRLRPNRRFHSPLHLGHSRYLPHPRPKLVDRLPQQLVPRLASSSTICRGGACPALLGCSCIVAAAFRGANSAPRMVLRGGRFRRSSDMAIVILSPSDEDGRRTSTQTHPAELNSWLPSLPSRPPCTSLTAVPTSSGTKNAT